MIAQGQGFVGIRSYNTINALVLVYDDRSRLICGRGCSIAENQSLVLIRKYRTLSRAPSTERTWLPQAGTYPWIIGRNDRTWIIPGAEHLVHVMAKLSLPRKLNTLMYMTLFCLQFRTRIERSDLREKSIGLLTCGCTRTAYNKRLRNKKMRTVLISQCLYKNLKK